MNNDVPPSEVLTFRETIADARQLLEAFQRAMIEARDSIPPPFSQQIRDQNEKIESLVKMAEYNREEISKLSERMEPVARAFDADNTAWERIKIYAARIGVISALILGVQVIFKLFAK